MTNPKQPQDMYRPILCVGSQRSGTSLVAGVLFHLGVFMGHWFLKKDSFNPTGYFEDTEFGSLDEDRHLEKINKQEWEVGYKALIKSRKSEIPGFCGWGWKNPSAALFIDDIIKLVNPRIIWCQRDKEDTKKSIDNKYDKMVSTKDGINIVDAEDTYNSKVKKLLKVEDKCFIIKFEDILKRPEYEVGRLAGFVGIKPTDRKLEKALNHILVKDSCGAEETYMNYL